MSDARLTFPATARNRDAILAVLRQFLPPTGLLLEVASGGGEHVAYFAANLPGWRFQPTDITAERRASIDAWCAELANVAPALMLDTTAAWPVARADAVLCSNMIHIAPWEAGLGLFRGAAEILGVGGVLILYGPFIVEGQPTAESNLAFDADLRGRDPAWGLRGLAEVTAAAVGFAAPEVVAMPANNLCLVFRRV